jgi:hypothetical protein
MLDYVKTIVTPSSCSYKRIRFNIAKKILCATEAFMDYYSVDTLGTEV